MKKFVMAIFTIAFFAALTFVMPTACGLVGSHTADAVDSTVVDSVEVVDSTIVDSTVVDSIEVVK